MPRIAPFTIVQLSGLYSHPSSDWPSNSTVIFSSPGLDLTGGAGAETTSLPGLEAGGSAAAELKLTRIPTHNKVGPTPDWRPMLDWRPTPDWRRRTEQAEGFMTCSKKVEHQGQPVYPWQAQMPGA